MAFRTGIAFTIVQFGTDSGNGNRLALSNIRCPADYLYRFFLSDIDLGQF